MISYTCWCRSIEPRVVVSFCRCRVDHLLSKTTLHTAAEEIARGSPNGVDAAGRHGPAETARQRGCVSPSPGLSCFAAWLFALPGHTYVAKRSHRVVPCIFRPGPVRQCLLDTRSHDSRTNALEACSN